MSRQRSPQLIREYRDYFVGNLAHLYDKMEATNFFHLALEHYRQLQRSDLALNPGLTFSEDELEIMEKLQADLLLEKPIQNLLGKAHFYGLEFTVNANVLIPRPETEELVDWIISDHAAASPMILDIGTGSGCIAISLAKNLQRSTVTAMDVSGPALATAKLNALKNDVNVQFLQQNILECNGLEKNYDIIVSNPPYVRELEKHEIRKNVLSHEPHLALFVADNDPLLFYRKIAGLALGALPEGGKLYFEINQYLGPQTVDLLAEAGYKDILLRKDIYGNDRMIRATR